MKIEVVIDLMIDKFKYLSGNILSDIIFDKVTSILNRIVSFVIILNIIIKDFNVASYQGLFS